MLSEESIGGVYGHLQYDGSITAVGTQMWALRRINLRFVFGHLQYDDSITAVGTQGWALRRINWRRASDTCSIMTVLLLLGHRDGLSEESIGGVYGCLQFDKSTALGAQR